MSIFDKVIKNALALLLIACFVGCGSETYTGPVELPEAELPQAIRAAFAEASEPAKGMAEKAVSLFENEKYPESMSQLRLICDLREITDKRRQIASRGIFTLSAKIREAAESEDDKSAKKSAKKYIRYNQLTK